LIKDLVLKVRRLRWEKDISWRKIFEGQGRGQGYSRWRLGFVSKFRNGQEGKTFLKKKILKKLFLKLLVKNKS